ncbi:MAG: hypothetical protein LBP65_02335 [Puniceicoccales bacterium]|jgi:hypothetical protein|nr:hypothetical protein [Puniceicoccales bacterium]
MNGTGEKNLQNAKRWLRLAFAQLDRRFRRATAGWEPEKIYLNIAGVSMRVDCYVNELVDPIRQQLAYCCQDGDDGDHEILLNIWNEQLAPYVAIPEWACHSNHLRTIVEYSEPHWAFQRLIAHDRERRIGYLLNPVRSAMEVFVRGHILVKSIYLALLEDNRSLFHAAAIGWKNRGALICGRGGRGKSTLAISGMIGGFQYVSDDYLILEKNANGLCAYPIYSIVTLAEEMQAKLPPLWGDYLYPNYNGKKDVIKISARHDFFAPRLPIVVGIFPEVRTGEKPAIEAMHPGRAITQAVHSTIVQTQFQELPKQVRRLSSLLRSLPFYRFYVGECLEENVAVLRKFLEKQNVPAE